MASDIFVSDGIFIRQLKWNHYRIYYFLSPMVTCLMIIFVSGQRAHEIGVKVWLFYLWLSIKYKQRSQNQFLDSSFFFFYAVNGQKKWIRLNLLG